MFTFREYDFLLGPCLLDIASVYKILGLFLKTFPKETIRNTQLALTASVLNLTKKPTFTFPGKMLGLDRSSLDRSLGAPRGSLANASPDLNRRHVSLDREVMLFSLTVSSSLSWSWS